MSESEQRRMSDMLKTRIYRLKAYELTPYIERWMTEITSESMLPWPEGKPSFGGFIETEAESARMVIEEIADQLENNSLSNVARHYLVEQFRSFLNNGGSLDEAFFLSAKRTRGNPGVSGDEELAHAVCAAYLGVIADVSPNLGEEIAEAEMYSAAEIAAYDEWRRLRPQQLRRSANRESASEEGEHTKSDAAECESEIAKRDAIIRRTILPRLMEWLPDHPRWKGRRRVKSK